MTPEYDSVLQGFRHSLADHPDAPIVSYFDSVISVSELDRLSDAFAVGLAREGIEAGERVALFMQNMPSFVIALLGGWKIGAIPVPLNPMLRKGELEHHLNDCGAAALVTLDSLWEEIGRDVVGSTAVRVVVTASALDMQTRNDARLFPTDSRPHIDDAHDFATLLESNHGQRPAAYDPAPEEAAFLCYTSGTTGEPKAAVCSHRNVLTIAQIIRDVAGITSASTVLGLAPLFHITGLVVQLMPCLISSASIALSYRYQPGVVLDCIRENRPTFAVGAITAYVGLLQDPGFAKDDFESFDRIHSGGAPISPATARAFEEQTGKQLLGAYGMTEATSATHLGPKGVAAPVDPGTGALAVGIPTPGTRVHIVDDDGNEVPPGMPGEVVLESPGVIAGYWNRPEATAATIRDGRLYSGDVGVMDESGWLFLIDRKKDLINCSGFKVWPREVEDALYEHPAVREAAVVGIPDDYRGESVKAYVSLKANAQVSAGELIAFVGDRLSAYKRPRELEVLPELPKTPSGKILRRELKERSSALPTATLTSKS